VSKDSIRAKIDEAKARTKLALESGKASPEIKASVESMLLVLEIVVAIFLEKKPRKNSSNSGLPPSRNNGSNGNRNKGSGDRSGLGEAASNVQHTETSETTTPGACSKCGEDLAGVKVTDTEERQKIDILYEVVTHTVVAEVKVCPGCGKCNKGSFPEGMDGKVQYGDTVKAMVINFMCVQMMSLQRLQEHMMSIMGRSLSQAIMLKYLLQFSVSLRKWEEEQIIALFKCKFIHCDETSVRINKVNWWVHSYSSGDITLKLVHRHRGREAIDEINIIPKYTGTLIHDCWASYLSYNNTGHALCGAHLLRELKYIEDADRYAWATKLKLILQDALEVVNSRPGKRTLTKAEYKSLQSRYRNALTRGLGEMPAFPEKSGSKGRTKKTDAQNLWERLWKYEDSVLMFARVKEIDFTNNRAERDLRVSKVKQKVSGGFRTHEMAVAFYRISSYVKSMKYRGYSSMEAIMLALQGKIPS
jgi:hypothetical protein